MSALIFDTELTGLKNGEIIDAAWLRLATITDLAGESDAISLDIAEEFRDRYKPSNQITFGAMAVHHILPHELDGCRGSWEFVLPGECAYLIGHSIDFDWTAAGSPSRIKRICTHAMAQWLWPDASGYSQSALIYMLEGATPETRAMVQQAHGALADVRMNHILLRHILRLNPEITTWSQLWQYSEDCRVPRTCPMKKYEGVLLEDLDTGFIQWCLNLYDLDPYYRKGLQRVMDARCQSGRSRYSDDLDSDDDSASDDVLPIHSRYPNDVVNESPPDDGCADCVAHPSGVCNEHVDEMPF